MFSYKLARNLISVSQYYAVGNMTRPRQGERDMYVQYFVIDLKR